MYLLVLHEFEQDQEGDDDLLLALLRFQKGTKIGLRMCLKIGTDVERLIVYIDFFALDLTETAADRIAAALFSSKNFPENFFQTFKIGVPQKLFVVDGRLVAANFFWQILCAVIADACLFPAGFELSREIFVHLVFQETADQLLAGVFLFLAVFLVFFTRQEHAALDVQKRCGHDQKFAGDIHVFMVHLPDIFEVLIGDLNDRNVVDVYFVFFDQVHEQVQRTFKHRKLYGYGHNNPITIMLLFLLQGMQQGLFSVFCIIT